MFSEIIGNKKNQIPKTRNVQRESISVTADSIVKEKSPRCHQDGII